MDSLYVPYTVDMCRFRDIAPVGIGLVALCANKGADCCGEECREGLFPDGCPFKGSKPVGKGFRYISKYGQPRD